MKDFQIEKDEVDVRFNVVTLYTCIPVKDGLEYLNSFSISDSSLEERTLLAQSEITRGREICLESTCSTFEHDSYKKMDGVAMG